MSYYVYVFRKEVRDQKLPPNFLENMKAIGPAFTDAQIASLKDRLGMYGYAVTHETSAKTQLSNEEWGVEVTVMPNYLLFASGTGDELFEALQTASELTDSGEFAKFDPQEGGWEDAI